MDCGGVGMTEVVVLLLGCGELTVGLCKCCGVLLDGVLRLVELLLQCVRGGCEM